MHIPDRYNCRHEWEQDLIEEARKQKHLDGECDGVSQCDYCQDEGLFHELSSTEKKTGKD